MLCRLIGLTALACAIAGAQIDTGAIRVLVSDATGLAAGDAKVELTNAGTGIMARRTTDSTGYATFTPIPRGTYFVTVEKSGFQSTRVSDIALDVDERKLVRVALKVQAVNTTVEVSASADIIQSEQGSIGQVIDGNVAVELPLNGRSYVDLALLVPGASESTLDPTTRGSGWFVANGNYQTQNNFMVDGVDNNQGTTNAQTLSAQVIQPSPDAIGEFKVQTNSYSAEFGRSAGAAINVALKSGTNSIHGSGWLYNRESDFAATPWAANLIGAPKPVLNWNQFGGTFGGPVRKNKLFYFADYEGFMRNFQNQFLVTVPTLNEKKGIYYRNINDPNGGQFPTRTIPVSRMDPLGKKLVDLYPDPNLAGTVAASGQTIQNYGVQRDGRENTEKGDLKADYNAGVKDLFTMRWSTLHQDIFRDSILPGLADGQGNQGAQFNSNQSFGANWTRTISPSVINFLRFGYLRSYGTFSHATAGATTASDFGFPGIPPQSFATGGLPQINVSNYNGMGVRNFRPQFQEPETFQFIDTLSIVRGKHSFRTGVETRLKNNSFLDSQHTLPAYTFNGNFTGEALADLAIGYTYQYDANSQAVVEQLQNVYSAFAQDDWKISPNLTVNLGLRYDYTTPYYGTGKNKNINFDLDTGKLLYAKDPTDYLVNTDPWDFGPRLGIAYQIIPQKLVLRGGYGIFYSGEDMSGSNVNLPLNPPQLIPVTMVRTANGPPVLKVSAAPPSNLFDTYNTTIVSLRAREKDYKSAMIHQFNAALQYRLPMQSTIEVSYVGNRGNRLFAEYAANQVPFGTDGSVARNRPYPEWAQIEVGSQRAQSWYNSLQLKIEKRFTHGWYELFSYTYASAIDEAGAWDAGTNPQYRDSFLTDRGPSRQNARNRFTTSSIYNLPVGRGQKFGSHWNRFVDGVLGGWQIAHIITFRSGLPINVSLNGSSTDPRTRKSYRFLNRNGGSLRPDRVGDPNTGIDPKVDRLHFLNIDGFLVQPVNTPGNTQRDVALSPKFFNTSLSLAKHFRITERGVLDLRLEAFNAFNNVNFGNPAATYPNSDFGTISSAGDPRIVQTAIRFKF